MNVSYELRRTWQRFRRSVRKRVDRLFARVARHPMFDELVQRQGYRRIDAIATGGQAPAGIAASPPTEQQRGFRINNAPTRLREGICIVGYLKSEIGLGQAARCLGYACDSVRLPVSFCHLPLPGRENEVEFATKCNPVQDRKASILITGLPSIVQQQGEARGGRINILFPYWELGRIPPAWIAAACRFDEVWAPSGFIATALEPHFGKRLHLVRQPLWLPSEPPPPRAGVSRLKVLAYFDFDSFGARKNPQGAVKAFQAAFPAARRDVELVVKVRGEGDGGLRGWLHRISEADNRITIIVRTLDRDAMNALMRDCDVFLSLHRSEGFGFGAAEALAAGRAVVATDFSATTDFVSARTGYPVPFELVSVRPGEYVDTDRQVWAEPSIEAAAVALREIYDCPAEARARAEQGFAVLKAEHAPEVIGNQIRSHLSRLGAIGSQAPSGARTAEFGTRQAAAGQ